MEVACTLASYCSVFPFCHCYLDLKCPLLLMPSFLLCTGCHFMSLSSQIEFLKFQLPGFYSRPAQSETRAGVFLFLKTTLQHSYAQLELKTTVLLHGLEILQL